MKLFSKYMGVFSILLLLAPATSARVISQTEWEGYELTGILPPCNDGYYDISSVGYPTDFAGNNIPHCVRRQAPNKVSTANGEIIVSYCWHCPGCEPPRTTIPPADLTGCEITHPNGKPCYKCPSSGTCSFIYKEADCNKTGFKPGPDFCTLNNSEKRYKECICDEDNGYFAAEKLNNDSGIAHFIDTPETLTKEGKVTTCIKRSCSTNSPQVNPSDFYYSENNLDRYAFEKSSKEIKAYTNRYLTCSYLTLDSSLKDPTHEKNIYCIREWGCKGACTNNPSKECAQYEADESFRATLGNQKFNTIFGNQRCYYYTGCSNEGTCGGATNPCVNVNTSTITTWDPDTGKTQKHLCTKMVECRFGSFSAESPSDSYLCSPDEWTHHLGNNISINTTNTSAGTCNRIFCESPSYFLEFQENTSIVEENLPFGASYTTVRRPREGGGEDVIHIICQSGTACFSTCSLGMYYNKETQECQTTPSTDYVFLSSNETTAHILNISHWNEIDESLVLSSLSNSDVSKTQVETFKKKLGYNIRNKTEYQGKKVCLISSSGILHISGEEGSEEVLELENDLRDIDEVTPVWYGDIRCREQLNGYASYNWRSCRDYNNGDYVGNSSYSLSTQNKHPDDCYKRTQTFQPGVTVTAYTCDYSDDSSDICRYGAREETSPNSYACSVTLSDCFEEENNRLKTYCKASNIIEHCADNYSDSHPYKCTQCEEGYFLTGNKTACLPNADTENYASSCEVFLLLKSSTTTCGDGDDCNYEYPYMDWGLVQDFCDTHADACSEIDDSTAESEIEGFRNLGIYFPNKNSNTCERDGTIYYKDLCEGSLIEDIECPTGYKKVTTCIDTGGKTYGHCEEMFCNVPKKAATNPAPDNTSDECQNGDLIYQNLKCYHEPHQPPLEMTAIGVVYDAQKKLAVWIGDIESTRFLWDHAHTHPLYNPVQIDSNLRESRPFSWIENLLIPTADDFIVGVAGPTPQYYMPDSVSCLWSKDNMGYQDTLHWRDLNIWKGTQGGSFAKGSAAIVCLNLSPDTVSKIGEDGYTGNYGADHIERYYGFIPSIRDFYDIGTQLETINTKIKTYACANGCTCTNSSNNVEWDDNGSCSFGNTLSNYETQTDKYVLEGNTKKCTRKSGYSGTCSFDSERYDLYTYWTSTQFEDGTVAVWDANKPVNEDANDYPTTSPLYGGITFANSGLSSSVERSRHGLRCAFSYRWYIPKEDLQSKYLTDEQGKYITNDCLINTINTCANNYILRKQGAEGVATYCTGHNAHYRIQNNDDYGYHNVDLTTLPQSDRDLLIERCEDWSSIAYNFVDLKCQHDQECMNDYAVMMCSKDYDLHDDYYQDLYDEIFEPYLDKYYETNYENVLTITPDDATSIQDYFREECNLNSSIATSLKYYNTIEGSTLKGGRVVMEVYDENGPLTGGYVTSDNGHASVNNLQSKSYNVKIFGQCGDYSWEDGADINIPSGFIWDASGYVKEAKICDANGCKTCNAKGCKLDDCTSDEEECLIEGETLEKLLSIYGDGDGFPVTLDDETKSATIKLTCGFTYTRRRKDRL